MNYTNLLIVNTYADENYGSTAQKWKVVILPDRSDEEDDFHASILVAQTGGKQDLLKSLDISIYQIPLMVIQIMVESGKIQGIDKWINGW